MGRPRSRRKGRGQGTPAIVVTDSIPGDWVIEKVSPTERVTIAIMSETMVLPPRATLGLSSSVKVRALEKEDGLVAVWVKVQVPEQEELEFEGTIADNNEGQPGNWVIEAFSPTREITVTVTQSTLLIPSASSLTVDSRVEVKAVKLEGGTLRALWIKLEEEDDEEESVEADSVEASIETKVQLESESHGGKEPALDADSAAFGDVNVLASGNWMAAYRGLRLGGPIE